MKLEGIDMVREHNEEFHHVKNVKLIEKRKNRDKRFFKVEVVLFGIAAILLLNEDITWTQMMISGAFAVAGVVADTIRRFV